MPNDEITVTPHVQIPARDGTLLSAAVHWPPGGPDGGPYPSLIEYHPYRKDDKSAGRASDHRYFARNGFVSVQLDVRGTGGSLGVNTDEYMAVETTDGYDVVEWLASQPWSNGNVGMFGSSYGGFTSIQVAMLQPPSLKAIVPIYATDDRYTDDCHYRGGALKCYYDTGLYGTMMVAINALPPDPEQFGDGWKEEWERRLDVNTPYALEWLDHSRDGEYWRPGSLRGKYDSVKAATFIIGGWQDGYAIPSVRAFENIGCTKKIMMGPWNHSRPDVAKPGPRIDYLNEMRRWFDLHLKGSDDGIGSEPPVTMYVQSYDLPDPARTDTSGEWRSEMTWPAESAGEKVFYLGGAEPAGGHRLTDKPVVSMNTSSLRVDPVTGLRGGLWSGGIPFGLPGDQREDEALSLTYTTMPLREPLTIAGQPKLEVTVSSDVPVAMFVVKLSDVGPDGKSALIGRGMLNGTRRNSMETPEPMEPHEPYRIAIELDATVWKLERGHRLRLAISGSDFPNSWPMPETARIEVSTGGTEQATLTLPTLEGEGLAPPELLPPPSKPAPASPPRETWAVTERPLEGTVTLEMGRSAESRIRDGLAMFSSDDLTLTANRKNSADVTASGRSVTELTYGSVTLKSDATQVIRSDRTHFHWNAEVIVSLDGEEKRRLKWEKSFPRDLM